MTEPRSRSSKGAPPGLRALAASGDGFWEIDLIDGSAWFSEWFYQKLGWSPETKRAAVNDLKDALDPAEWEGFMRRFRAHLEQAVPFDPRLSVKCADGKREWWQLRGRAERTDGGLPIYVAGSARELSAAEAIEACPCGAFDELPVAAAILDARGEVLHTNALWRELAPCSGATFAQQIQTSARGVETLELTIMPPVDSRTGVAERKRSLSGHARRYESSGELRWVAVVKGR
ncbi:MAG TPA: hypothetical protein VKT22_12155 [Steroidobacteraceae bacterium]|nr:hypothetical protein [Steroidobacteraceae bacterium]